jgi:hypothetical protein
MQDIFLMKAEGADSQGNLKNEITLTGVRPEILDRLFDIGLTVPPEIARLFPDRRDDQVATVRLPSPPSGPLQRRLG